MNEEEKKIGYALQPIAEGSVISNSVTCNLPINNHLFFILAKRNELVFFEITEKGINPLFKIPFTKIITCLRVMTGKSLGRQYDLILCFFHDYSFIAFSNPYKIEFKYQPPTFFSNSKFICEIHNKTPILFIYNKLGQISYWNPIKDPKKIYNIHCPDETIIDFKFLPHQTIRLAVLMCKSSGKKFTKVFSFNENLLCFEEISNLGVIELDDPTTSFLIPLAHGCHERPVYLTIGTTYLGIVYKTGLVKVDSPFLGSPSLSFYRIKPFAVMIGTQKGSVYSLSFGQTLDIHHLGDLPIIPTSITNIDGNIFYFGSSLGNSIFAQITDTGIQVLQTLSQFIPVNSFSTFCDNIGEIFLTQNNQESSFISRIKTGSKFMTLMEIKAVEIESIFSACNHYIVCSKFNESSVCIDLEKRELVSNEMFISDSITLNVFEHDENSFIQVCPQIIRIVDFNDQIHKEISFDSSIMNSSCDGSRIVLLFSDHFIILSKELEVIDHINLENNQPCACSISNNFVSISSYSSEIQLWCLSDHQISIENVNGDELITFLNFIFYKNDLYLLAFSESGKIIRFLVENKKQLKLNLVGYIQIGYLTKTVFKVKVDNAQSAFNNVLFINGSSPMLLYPNGSFVPLIGDTPSAFCSIVNNYFALFNNMKLKIGTIDTSDVCSIHSREMDSPPRIFSIHQKPLSLFVAFEKSACFTISAFCLPSFSETYTQHFGDQETIECFYYHETYQTTFIGSITKSKQSRIFAVKDLFNQFKSICDFEIVETISSMASSKPNNLIVGSHYMLYVFQIEPLFNGLMKISQLQAITTNIIPKSISFFNQFLICFGETKYITTFIENQDNTFSLYENISNITKIHNGFTWRPFTAHSCRVFTIDNDHTLTISSYKFKDDTVTTKVLTRYELESPVIAFCPVRDGFALLATQNGSLYALEEYEMGNIALFNKISLEMSLLFPFTNNESKILDAATLNMFFDLPLDIQQRIAKTVKREVDDVKDLIESFSNNLTKLCST